MDGIDLYYGIPPLFCRWDLLSLPSQPLSIIYNPLTTEYFTLYNISVHGTRIIGGVDLTISGQYTNLTL